MVITIEYRELANKLFEKNDFTFLKNYVGIKYKISEIQFATTSAREKLYRFFKGFNEKFKQCTRNKKIFFNKFENNWLENQVSKLN